MIKEGDVIFTGVWMIVFLVIVNGAYLLYQIEDTIGFISGNSVGETIDGFYEVSSVNHRIFIAFQFLLLLVIVISFFIMIRKFKLKKRLSKSDFIKSGNTKSRTDLDTLYEILKNKKEIDISDIGKVFKVNPEIALEWSKILENGDLAMIDYLGFGRPVLRLLEENNKDANLSKEKIIEKRDIDSKKAVNENKNNLYKEIVSVKKIISKKEIRRNLKIKKQAEKIARKMNRKIEKLKKIKKKLKKT